MESFRLLIVSNFMLNTKIEFTGEISGVLYRYEI